MQPPNPEKTSERLIRKAKSNMQGSYAMLESAKKELTTELSNIQTGPLTVESNEQQIQCITDINLIDGVLLHLRADILTLEANGK